MQYHFSLFEVALTFQAVKMLGRDICCYITDSLIFFDFLSLICIKCENVAIFIILVGTLILAVDFETF